MNTVIILCKKEGTAALDPDQAVSYHCDRSGAGQGHESEYRPGYGGYSDGVNKIISYLTKG